MTTVIACYVVFRLFDTIPVGLGRVDGNSDNRANSAQFQLKLPAGADLCKRKFGETLLLFKSRVCDLNRGSTLFAGSAQLCFILKEDFTTGMSL